VIYHLIADTGHWHLNGIFKHPTFKNVYNLHYQSYRYINNCALKIFNTDA